MPNMLRALNSYNARLYFSGQGISVIGTWMQTIAVGWITYRLTNSLFLLGVASFAAQLPMFFLTPFTGALIDRWDKQKILICTQITFIIQASLFVFFITTNTLTIWHIVILNIILGIGNSFDMPARQSFLIETVEKREDLGNAIALNSAIANSARLIGPSIAGIIIAFAGEAPCFVVNGLSYFAMLFALLSIKLQKSHTGSREKSIISEIKEGLYYIYKFRALKFTLFLLALANLVATPYAVLLPAFAKDIIGGNSGTLGFLVGASGIGAIVGAVFLANRRNHINIERILSAAAFLFGIGLILLSYTKSFLWASIVMVLIGFGMMVHMASSNTYIQSIVDDNKRGRVMGFYSLSFLGMSMFGNLIIGTLAQRVGISHAVFIGGICFIVGTSLFVLAINLVSKNS